MADAVEITGVQLRAFGGKVDVLVEVGGSWRRVISESFDGEGVVNHIVEPLGIMQSPIEGDLSESYR